MNAKVTRWLRHVASAIATLAGVLLLLADTADDGANEDGDGGVGCEYVAFTGEFDYSSACPLLGSGGATALPKPSGHVSLTIPSVGDDISAGINARAAFNLAGLNVFHADVHYGKCSEHQPTYVEGVTIAVGRAGFSEFHCARLALPLNVEQTLLCIETIDAGAQPATCTITLTPTPR